jgi:methylglutaconyl-CoA hydratase
MAADILLSETAAPGVALLRINRPEAKNALNRDLRAKLAERFQALGADPEIRAIVLTGNEEAFAAGADIRDVAEADAIDMMTRPTEHHWRAIQTCPKPIIAAVRGFALGGGCELAMHCDIIVAGEGATFGQPEVKIGIIPGAGGTQRLPRLVGEARAKEIILLGRRLTACEALAWGLVNRVTPKGVDVVDDAIAWIEPIANGAPIAQAAALEAIDRSFDATLEQGLELEKISYDRTLVSEDRREALAAFAEKRKPAFKGR